MTLLGFFWNKEVSNVKLNKFYLKPWSTFKLLEFWILWIIQMKCISLWITFFHGEENMLFSFIFPNHLSCPLLLRNVLLYNTLQACNKSHFKYLCTISMSGMQWFVFFSWIRCCWKDDNLVQTETWRNSNHNSNHWL